MPLRQVEWNVLEEYHRAEIEAKKVQEEDKAKILYEEKGFSQEGGEGDNY